MDDDCFHSLRCSIVNAKFAVTYLGLSLFRLAPHVAQSGKTEEATCGNKLEDDVTRALYLSANGEKARRE
jgi:hypothetical protein